MKRLCFIILCSLLYIGAKAQTQTRKVVNNTHCSVSVTMECYDLCVLISSHTSQWRCISNISNTLPHE